MGKTVFSIGKTVFSKLIVSSIHGAVSGCFVLCKTINSCSSTGHQIVSALLGGALLALSLTLFLKNRFITAALILVTFLMPIHHAKGASLDSDYLGLVPVLTFIIAIWWYGPQFLLLVNLLGLTWDDHKSIKERLRLAREVDYNVQSR